MSFLGKLFGSAPIIDGAMKGMDAVVFTAEERAEMHGRLLKLYEPFKLAQRFIALIMCVPYAVAWLLTFIASFWVETLTVQKEILSGDMGMIVLVIVGFYFGGGTLESFVRAKNK